MLTPALPLLCFLLAGPPEEPSSGLAELRKLGARLHLPKDGPSYCYLGHIDDYVGGYVTDVRPGILRLLEDEPQIKGLTLSASVGEKCYGCPDRVPFTDEVLKDLPRLTHLTSLRLEGIDLSDPQRFAFVQPLNNLETLQLKLCEVSLTDLFARCGPHPKLKRLVVDQPQTFRKTVEGTYEPTLPEIAIEDPPVVTVAQVRRFVESVPNLEELRIGLVRTERLEYAAVRELSKLTKLKKLRITGFTYGPIPMQCYPPEVTAAHEELEAWLREQLPEVERPIDVIVARGLIDWPALGLPTPTVPECDCDPEPPCSTGSGADKTQRSIENAELRQLLRDLKRGEEVVAEMRERNQDPRLIQKRLEEVFAMQERIKEFLTADENNPGPERRGGIRPAASPRQQAAGTQAFEGVGDLRF